MPTLSPSALVEAQVLADKFFADSARKADYVVEVNAAKAIIENTTADMTIVERTDKTLTVSAKFNNFCDDDVNTSAPNYCTISGTEADSGKKDYIIGSNVNKSFTIDEGNYRTNFLDFSSVFADNMLKSMKAMDEKIAQVVVAKVQSFASENLNQVSGIGCPGVVSPESWDSTYIKPANWSPSIMGYFAKTARINKFSAPFLLDGKNLFDHYVAAQMNQANADGKGAMAWFNLVKYYEDLINVEAVASGSTFMVQRGAVAFASKAYWGSFSEAAPKTDANGRMKYSVPSKNIPGVKYDVYVTEECSGKDVKYNVLMDLNYDVFNGPASCNSQTGVLEFICGACPQ